jgi:hypothetical protein
VEGLGLTYQPDDQSTVLLLLALDAGLLFLIFWRYSGVWMRRIMGSIPWGTMTLGALNFVIGAGLGTDAYPGNWELNPTTLFWFPLLLGLWVSLGGLAGLPRLRRLQHAKENITHAIPSIHNGLLRLAFILCVAISFRALFPVAVIWGLLFLLNEDPLNLRRTPLLRNLLEAMALFAAALAGFGAMGGPMVGFPTNWMLPLLLVPVFVGIALDEIGALSSRKQWILLGCMPFQILLALFAWDCF